ncbi:MAG: hypothetical protein D6791_06780 [Chloroflexi bacterium]|nr:MAG: hypothetical protein D6791_06780 [Chloroflexota bacterium]
MYKDYPLIFADSRLDQADIEGYLERAWNAICEVEYDYVFQAFNGIYLNEEKNQVEITFGFASGSIANMGMICINRETGDDYFDFPPRERVEHELAILSELLGTDVLAWEREQQQRFINHLTRGGPTW